MASSSDESHETFFNNCLIFIYLISPTIFIAGILLKSPYGKHRRPGWGPTVSPPLAWFLMESPTLWLTLLLFPFGLNSSNPKALVLMTPFLAHYLHRTCLYPFRLLRRNANPKTAAADFPVVVAGMAFFFNLLNAYLQCRWVSHYKDFEGDGHWFWWKYSAGLLVFLCGMYVNVWSDRVLLGLKREGGGYKVPRGGWFELVSCPNYFGEILEWFGWALMTWSWAGLGFLLFTTANLVPRAVANHRWYLDKFGEDYPKSRKAVIPYLY